MVMARVLVMSLKVTINHNMTKGLIIKEKNSLLQFFKEISKLVTGKVRADQDRSYEVRELITNDCVNLVTPHQLEGLSWN